MLIRYILCTVIAYLLGSISNGILIAKKSGHDIRSEGSKNTGASNALRVLGLKAGILTFVTDALKAVAAVLIGKALCGENGGMLAGLFVIIGHNWPCFFGFAGGKGIACSVGVLLVMQPLFGGIAVLVTLIVIATTKYISVGSLTMVTLFALFMLIFRPFFPHFIWALVLAALAFYRHRTNLQRLMNGTENKLGAKKK